MRRRELLRVAGAGAAAALAYEREAEARQTGSAPPPDLRVGSLDLATFEIIDGHIHPPRTASLAAHYEGLVRQFVDRSMPPQDFPERAAVRAEVAESARELLFGAPRRTGRLNYVARVYGVEPTTEGFDSATAASIKRDLTAHIRSILDREKIARVVLQILPAETKAPATDLPHGRFLWTFPLLALLQPDWAKSKGATTIADVVHHLDSTLDECVKNGCAGFKSTTAYYRSFAIERVATRDADAALKLLLQATASEYRTILGEKVPAYRDAATSAALRRYQDFVLKRLFIKAGQVKRPVLFHSAVALSPELRVAWGNPEGLYSVLEDPEIRQANTQFVLLHAGFPSHHVTAAMLSQFTNLFADVSFISKFPLALEDALRTFLAVAPANKVMHGSDGGPLPEELGYCAFNTRRALARILNEYRNYYGWSESDCSAMAASVMSGTARRLYKIDG